MRIFAFDLFPLDSEMDDLCRSPSVLYRLVVQIVAVFAILFHI